MTMTDQQSVAGGIGGPVPGEAGIADVAPAMPPRAEVWKRFKRNKMAMAGLAFIILLVVVALFANIIAPYGETESSRPAREGPSGSHWFGLDGSGFDVLSRVMLGARVSLRVGFGGTAIALSIGLLFGAIAGYFGGWVDSLLMRITDVFLAIPYIVLAISVATVFGESVNSIMLVLGLTGWLPLSRIVRASFLSIKNLEYIEAATALGFSRKRIMFGHILPNALQPIIVFGTISVGSMILSEAALAYLNIGAQHPTPSWGLMIRTAGSISLGPTPHMLMFPALAIFFTVLAFVFVGDGLRDALDPKLK